MSQTVEVTLPESTLYVYGTVNGVPVTWTNVSGNTWQAEAARAADGIYVIELSVEDENGGAIFVPLVLFYGGLNLITDRTSRDVERWKELRDKGFAAMSDAEKTEWLGALKGCYSYMDMNRGEGAVAMLAEKLSSLGFYYAPQVKLNWTLSDIPTNADMERYFGNIAGLRNLLPQRSEIPVVPPVGSTMDFSTANMLEQILLDINRAMESIPSSWLYAGEIYAGEG